MKKETKKQMAPALMIGLIGTLFAYVLNGLFYEPLWRWLAQSGNVNIVINILVNMIGPFVGMLCAEFIYAKGIAKAKAPVAALLLAALGAAAVGVLVRHLLLSLRIYVLFNGALGTLVALLINFGSMFAAALLLVQKGKLAPPSKVQSASAPMADGYTRANAPAGNAAQPASTPLQQSTVVPEDMDGLSASLLNAIRPSLKAPMTAVLCSREEMKITMANGEYAIDGYVNSQNSYGALISTDFQARARYSGGTWVITDMKVGVKNAKTFGKNFAVNYIAITIFTGLMGLLGYYILTLIIN